MIVGTKEHVFDSTGISFIITSVKNLEKMKRLIYRHAVQSQSNFKTTETKILQVLVSKLRLGIYREIRFLDSTVFTCSSIPILERHVFDLTGFSFGILNLIRIQSSRKEIIVSTENLTFLSKLETTICKRMKMFHDNNISIKF